MAPPAAPIIPGWHDLSPIASGGTASVWSAHDPWGDRRVAIKILTAMGGESTRRFESERMTLGALSDHPHVVTVHATGFTPDGHPFLVMEFCPGGSLADELLRTGRFTLPRALSVMIPIADAVAAGHQLRTPVLHRDIKPRNILLDGRGTPVLADFGVAGFADEGPPMTAVTPSHLPPELLFGGRHSPSSDLYSLASTLYELLEGRPPFTRPDEPIEVLLRRIREEPAPPLSALGAGPYLGDVIGRALAKVPADRSPDTVSEFADLLRAVASRLGIATHPLVRLDVGLPPTLRSGDRPAVFPEPPPDGEGDRVAVARTARHGIRRAARRQRNSVRTRVTTLVAVAVAAGGIALFLRHDDPPPTPAPREATLNPPPGPAPSPAGQVPPSESALLAFTSVPGSLPGRATWAVGTYARSATTRIQVARYGAGGQGAALQRGWLGAGGEWLNPGTAGARVLELPPGDSPRPMTLPVGPDRVVCFAAVPPPPAPATCIPAVPPQPLAWTARAAPAAGGTEATLSWQIPPRRADEGEVVVDVLRVAPSGTGWVAREAMVADRPVGAGSVLLATRPGSCYVLRPRNGLVPGAVADLVGRPVKPDEVMDPGSPWCAPR